MSLKRREVVTGLAVAVGGQLLSSRNARSQPAGRLPLLTASNVNRVIRQAKRRGQFQQIAEQASQDLQGFLKNRFQLTESQIRLLDGLNTDQIALIQGAINESLEPDIVLQMETGGLSDDAGVPIDVETQRNEVRKSLVDVNTGDITIVIIKICRTKMVNETIDNELEALVQRFVSP